MSDVPWWILALAAAGVLGIGTAIMSLFVTLGRRPQRMWTDEIGAVDSPDFLRPLASLLNVPLRSGGTTRLLHNGDGWIPVLFDEFAAAERSINFMVYIWEPGRMSDMFVDALVERARAGIQVRVLLDGLGGIRCPDEAVDRIRAAGGHVERFRPPRFGWLTRFHRRNHRRAIIIDGRVAFTGGMAVGDKWLGDARNEDEWRDCMVRVDGCMALNVQSAFSELWAYCTGEVLTGDSFFPDDDTAEQPDGIRSISVISSPSSEEHPLRLFFFLSFLAARERLWITTPYLVPDMHTRQVLKRRARAGVDVRILVPGEHIDAKPIRWASHHYYEELLNAGIRIFEYEPSMMHAKLLVVDGKWCGVGSANMDIRSKELNEENVLGILDPTLARDLEETFERDMKRCTEIDRAQWGRRGPIERLRERVCVLFAEQY